MIMSKQSAREKPWREVLLLIGIGLALAWGLASGCSFGPERAAPVDAPRAREALRTALESWKKGELPGALKSASPAITVQDMDWEAGQNLVDYEVVGDGKDDDANLPIPVKLTLVGPKGKKVQKDVKYIVGTSPSVTVFRDFF